MSNVFHDMVMEVAVLRQELKKEKQLVQEMEQQVVIVNSVCCITQPNVS